MMSMPSADPSAQQNPAIPDIAKSSDAVMQGLGQMLKSIHVASPDSPMADAVTSVMKAVAEIVRNAGAPTPAMPDPAAAMGGGMPPEEDPAAMMGAVEGGMPPEEPPATMADAASQTHSMMLDAAMRRKQQG